MSDLVGYYHDGNTVRGPFSPSDLKRLVSDGKITASTLIRRGKDGQWIEAKRVGGLSPKLSETAELRDGGVLPQNAPPVTLAEESGHSLPQQEKLGTSAIARPPEPAPALPPSIPIVCVPQLPAPVPVMSCAAPSLRTFRMICGQCRAILFVEKLGVMVACPHCGVQLSIPSPKGSILQPAEPASPAREIESAQYVVAAERADEFRPRKAAADNAGESGSKGEKQSTTGKLIGVLFLVAVGLVVALLGWQLLMNDLPDLLKVFLFIFCPLLYFCMPPFWMLWPPNWKRYDQLIEQRKQRELEAKQIAKELSERRVKKTLATSNLPDGRNTMKVTTVVCIILAVIVPFWPISAPLFLYLANKSFKDPN